MANNFTYLGAQKLLDHIFGGTAFAQPAEMYLSLHTADPTKTGSVAAEVSTSGTGYARQAVDAAMDDAGAANGTTQNSVVVTFPTALTDWGDITHIGFHTAASGSGNMIMFAALPLTRTIETTDVPRFLANQIVIVFS